MDNWWRLNEIRKPKGQRNSKSEGRNPKSESKRRSDFGFLSDFGLRSADFRAAIAAHDLSSGHAGSVFLGISTMSSPPFGSSSELGLAGRIARAFIDSKLTPLVVLTSILLGAAAIIMLPR